MSSVPKSHYNIIFVSVNKSRIFWSVPINQIILFICHKQLFKWMVGTFWNRYFYIASSRDNVAQYTYNNVHTGVDPVYFVMWKNNLCTENNMQNNYFLMNGVFPIICFKLLHFMKSNFIHIQCY